MTLSSILPVSMDKLPRTPPSREAFSPPAPPNTEKPAMIRYLLGTLLACFPTSLCAQTSTTIPPGLDKAEGGMWINAPLVLTPARIQCGYDTTATGWTSSKKISELRARPDSSTFLRSAFVVGMEVILSSKGCDVETGSVRFSENHGTDKTVFMKQRNYAFPTFRGSYPGPAPWIISLKGDKPFLATTAKLLVDWATFTDSKNTNRSNYSFTIDAAVAKGGTTGTRGSVSAFGSPCWIKYFYVGASGVNTTDSVFRTFGHSGGAGNFVLAWLGTKKLAIPIPGRLGCYLRTEFLIFHPTIQRTTATGIATFGWGRVPTALVRRTVYSQMAALSPQGKLGFSPGLRIYFGDRKWVRNWNASYLMMYGQSGQFTFDPRKDLGRFHRTGMAIVFDVR